MPVSRFEVTSVVAAPPEEVWRRISTMAGVNAELGPIFRMTHPADVDSLSPDDVVPGERLFRSWVLLFGIVTPLSATADDSLVKFRGGIGVIPVSAGVAVAPTLPTAQTVESVNRNIVRGVQPPGQLWRIAGST